MTLRTLQPGDIIALVSPASPLDEDRLGPITKLLEGEGYKTKLFPNALRHEEYLAGSDAERAADLQAAYDDPEVAAVLCTRGGYGCARLFPHLDLDRMAETGKPLIGFSDITTLHLALNRRGLVTLHAPMALTLSYPRPEWVYESFRGALRGDYTTPYDIPLPTTVVPGVAEGEVTGGCMCLLTDSIGTPNALQTEGKILLLEDVDESPHRIDAMLTHLRNVGLLQACAGIVVGEMTRTDDHIDEGIGGRPWREIVRDRIADLGIPTIIDYPFGHAPGMLTLPLGLKARLDATVGTLVYM